MKHLILRLPVSAKIALAPLLVMICLLAVALQSYIGNRQTNAALQAISAEACPKLQPQARSKSAWCNSTAW